MANKLNIVFFSEVPFRAKKEATYKTLLGLAKEYKKYGHSTTIVCSGAKGIPKYELIDSIQVIRTGASRVSKLFGPAFIARKLSKKNKVHVVHNFVSAPVLSLKTLFTHLLVPHAKIVNTFKSYSRGNFFRFRFIRLLNFSELITTPTKEHKRNLVSRGVKGDKIIIINSPIDTKLFVHKPKKGLRKKYNLGSKKVVLYFGGLYQEKGISTLRDIISNINKHRSDIKFIIASRHLSNDFYKQTVGEIKKLKNTDLLFKDIDIIDYINFSEVVLLPYKNLNATEGNPSCLLESMACGTPVLTSALPEITEIVSNNEVVLAEANNIDDYVDKLNKLLDDNAWKNRLSKEAKKVGRRFNFKRISKELLDLYK